jgi:cytosine/adenosine deaminase-related metal-dependent hydrolase
MMRRGLGCAAVMLCCAAALPARQAAPAPAQDAAAAKPAEQESPMPELPADIPKDAVVRMFVTDKTPAGQDAVWTTPDGAIHEFFQFNDRGRGPKIYTTYRVDEHGLIVFEESKGVDYMKTPVTEHFEFANGTATWKNQSEDAKQTGASGKIYVDLNGGPEAGAIQARALIASGAAGKLSVLPSGEATIRKLQSVQVEAAGQKKTVTLYEISGLDFDPSYMWLDEDRQFFANVFGWSGTIRKGFESAIPQLDDSQRQVETAYASELAKRMTHKPAGDIVIRNVALFDSLSGKLVAGQRVTIHGDRIASVAAEDGSATPAGAEAIDGAGKTLLPGLWDMHAHLFREDAFLDIAAGVTTIRDMGNPIDDLAKLRAQIQDGTQIGPRIVMAGFIDGPGPFEGPIKVLAATPEEARARVDRYADLGYVQIKIYSSVKPELVPIIAEEAHKRGLRVSGHVPSGMIAEQFVRDGADEIQHMNFVFLNFMPDVKETRTPARFIEPGKRGGALDLSSAPVNDFVAFLKAHHTVIDPTMAIWEATYVDRPGHPGHMEGAMFDRLPVAEQRGSLAAGEALDASDPAVSKQYLAAYANFERMLKKLYDNGVQVVAGTDNSNGYTLDRELEIYNEAGIPAAEVLRIATIKAATVMHMERDFGSVTAGKFADMVLVNGDPTARISDVRHVDTVIKGGAIYKAAELDRAFGIRPE